MTKLLRRDAVIALLLSGLVLISWSPRLRGLIDLRWDGGVYYTLGASLAEGKGYRLLYEPGEIQEVHYPPLLPAIIALHQLISGTTDPFVVGRILRLSWMLFHGLFVLLVYHFGKMYLSRRYAFLLALMCLMSARVTFMSDLCTPEILFSITTILFVIYSKTKPNQIGAYLLATGAYLLRTAGISLLAAWVAEKIFQKQYRAAAIRLLLSLIPVVGWSGYIQWVESTAEYRNPSYEYQRADYLNYNVSYARNLSYKDPYSPELGKVTSAGLLDRFADNAKLVPQSIAETLSWDHRSWRTFWEKLSSRLPITIPFFIPYSILVLPGWFILVGTVLQFKRERLLAMIILFSIVIVCSVPLPGHMVRYFVPLMPLLGVPLIKTLFMIGNWMKRTTASSTVRFFGGIFPGLLLFLFFVQEVFPLGQLYRKHHSRVTYDFQGSTLAFKWFHYNAAHRALDEGLDWLKNRTAENEIVGTWTPSWAYLKINRKAVIPPLLLDSSQAQRLMERVPVTYLIIDQAEEFFIWKYANPVVRSFPERWNLIYSNPVEPFFIFRLNNIRTKQDSKSN